MRIISTTVLFALLLAVLSACTPASEGVQTAEDPIDDLPASDEDSLIRPSPGPDTADRDSLYIPPPTDTLPFPRSQSARVIDSLYDCPICKVDIESYYGPLSVLEIQGLLIALNDVYRDSEQYEHISTELADFPFTEIREAELKQIEAIKGLFRKYGVLIPANPWEQRIIRYTDIEVACADMMWEEEADLKLFTYLGTTTRRDDILFVYRGLKNAAQDRHLPALRRCTGI